jgi:hypothetical protein
MGDEKDAGLASAATDGGIRKIVHIAERDDRSSQASVNLANKVTLISESTPAIENDL